jgi:hypothetical protein
MRRGQFFSWARTTLVGHMVVIGVPFMLAEMAVFLALFYSEGTLTMAWTIHMVIVTSGLGAVGGLLVWYIFTLPRIRRGKERR